MNDGDGCGGRKERTTEAEVDGQCQCELEGEGTVGGGDAKPGYVEAPGKEHRPPWKWVKCCGRRLLLQTDRRTDINRLLIQVQHVTTIIVKYRLKQLP